jgi:hypothetical protein
LIRPRARFLVGLISLLGLGIVVGACSSSPHAWYRIDDYPAFTLRPLLDFEPSVATEYSLSGAPPRMVLFNDQLQVQCSYCHQDADPRTNDLTPPGVESRLMMDIADRFRVECTFCHDNSPTKYTPKGKFAYRDMHLPERRWKCAVCHDTGFRLTRVR